MTNTALIEALDLAEGPSRELDARIAVQAMPDKDWLPSPPYPPGVYANANGSASGCPAYTSSIDAAMTLVPEGWGWNVSQPNAKALASGLLKEKAPVCAEVEFGFEQRFIVAGATPAIALCIAALRASAAK